jgi:hypothetical protein
MIEMQLLRIEYAYIHSFIYRVAGNCNVALFNRNWNAVNYYDACDYAGIKCIANKSKYTTTCLLNFYITHTHLKSGEHIVLELNDVRTIGTYLSKRYSFASAI